MGRFLAMMAWAARMAWRDSRRSRRRLLLYSSSIMLGIAALVAVGSFGRTLTRAIDEQAKSLLGADLAVTARHQPDPAAEAFLAGLGGEQAREIGLASMIQFPRQGETRLVQVRALAGGFPFYGTLETLPVEAAEQFRAGAGALVEESLLTQYDVAVGEPVTLGVLTAPVIGVLKRVPGEAITFATFAPRVFISLDQLARTELLQPGSLARYKTYYRFDDAVDVAALVAEQRAGFHRHRLRIETVASRRESVGETFDRFDQFLNLVGFVALLLGGIGIASAIHVHVKQKLGAVAVLRCLGATTRQTMAIYVIQGLALGLIGAVVGAALGLGLQRALPPLVRELTPFPIDWSVSWAATFQAMAIGVALCLLFTVLPLLAVRRVPPLAALRELGAETAPRWRDPWQWGVGLLIALGVTGFAIAQTKSLGRGLGFAVGLAAALGILGLVARLLAWTARRLTPAGWPYVVRQGLANLHRPNNRTVLVLFAVGLGTFLILTLVFVQQTLLGALATSRDEGQANAILFDIQSDQTEAVADLVRSLNLAVLQQAPIVTMRLVSVKDRPVEELLADPRRATPGWVLQREYRSTYREHLTNTETAQAGQWPPAPFEPGEPVPISVETGIARDLEVSLGDQLVFDVQGIPLRTRVASLRKVEWRRVQPNFFIVFPTAALERAPAFHVLATRVESAAESATLQRAAVRQFPNISAIDLTLVIQTIDSVVSRVAAVIRFMALFTVGTGLLVVAVAISTGRYQRLQESALLRTLGASRRQVWQALATEYLCLGLFAGLTGLILALAAGWGLAAGVFKTSFAPGWLPILTALAAPMGVTLVAGLFASRGIGNHPPLELLRAEG